MNKLFIIGLVVAAASFTTGCKKSAGEGGTALITGKIWVEDWNGAFTDKNGEYAGADEDVYIIYGDDISYGDRVRANYNGEFEFKYLRKGNYRVYVYSDDKTLTAVSGKVVLTHDVSISEKKETITIPTFTIYK